MEEELTINLVSEEEMYERNKFFNFNLIANPFLDFRPEFNRRKVLINAMSRGITLEYTKGFLKELYSQEAQDLIISKLEEGKTTFIIGFENGKGYVKIKEIKKPRIITKGS